METFLSASRWIIHKVFIALLGFTIWFYIPAIAFGVNFTNPGQVKSWLVESNTYENVLNESLTLIETENDEQVIADKIQGSAIDSNALIAAGKTAVTPDFLQEQTEEFVDGVYAWLRSETSQPKFELSLASRSNQIESALSKELGKQLAKLPQCTSLEQINPDQDPLEAECLPPGVSAQAEADKYINDFVNQQDGPIQSKFTGDDLNISSEAKLNAPVAFSMIELLPMFFWAFLASFSVIVIMSSKSLARGLKEVGTTASIASGILLFISLISLRLASAPGKYLIDPEGTDSQSQAARNIIEPLAKVVTTDVTKTSIFFAVLVFAMGLIIFFIGLYLGKQEPKSEKPNTKKENEVPELMRDDHDENFVDKFEQEKADEAKLRDKIKNKIKTPRKSKNKLIQ